MSLNWADRLGKLTPVLECFHFDQVRRRLTELTDDPEPVMRQLVRVFIGDGTYWPGFQFLSGGQLHTRVTSLFRHSLELRVAHNYFTAWMLTPTPDLGGARPVDCLREAALLHRALECFATDLPGRRQLTREAN